MAYISGISFHDVTSIEIGPEKENDRGGLVYVTRTITIILGEQQIDVTCFSNTVPTSDDGDLMPLKI